jgi:hypothetical protein
MTTLRTRFPVYSWPDGSSVELRIRAPGAVISGGVPPEDASMLMVTFKDDTRLGLRLKSGAETNGPCKSSTHFIKKSWIGSDFPGANRRGNREKLFGFFYDLKLPQLGVSCTLVMNKNELDWINFQGPTFVSDEVFDQRYDEARRRTPGHMSAPPFLGAEALAGARLRQIMPNHLWRSVWNDLDGDRKEFEAMSLEEAVDWLCEDAQVFPESHRADWEATNVERGTWLMPTPEEIEVFYILDEPLPFTWSYDALLQWVSGRAGE